VEKRHPQVRKRGENQPAEDSPTLYGPNAEANRWKSTRTGGAPWGRSRYPTHAPEKNLVNRSRLVGGGGVCVVYGFEMKTVTRGGGEPGPLKRGALNLQRPVGGNRQTELVLRVHETNEKKQNQLGKGGEFNQSTGFGSKGARAQKKVE